MAYDYESNTKEQLSLKLKAAVETLRFYGGVTADNRWQGVEARQTLAFIWDIDISKIQNVGEKPRAAVKQ